MRPSAGTPYFARVPETLVSPQALHDATEQPVLHRPLRTPEPKADAGDHATRAAPAAAKIHTLTSGMPGCRAPSSQPEPAPLATAAAVVPDQARAADGPSSKPNPGHGDIRRTNAAIDRKQPQKEATRT